LTKPGRTTGRRPAIGKAKLGRPAQAADGVELGERHIGASYSTPDQPLFAGAVAGEAFEHGSCKSQQFGRRRQPFQSLCPVNVLSKSHRWPGVAKTLRL